MPSILNEIGFFQFDNLIKNRIPFMLLNLGTNLEGLYKQPLYQKHLEGITQNATVENARQVLELHKHPKSEAVVIICLTGQTAPHLVDHLESAGYSNVFYVKDGLTGLRADASR